MATEEKWYFSKEQLDSTPSRQCGIDAYKELFYRQQAGNFIQDMGQRLKVSQLCINTAIVYMHRFYVFHSFTHFPWHSIAAAALFLAAKVEEQPRKLEHVIRVHNLCKNPHDNAFDVQSERYQGQSQDLVFNENVLLQTLGFDVAIDHPHAHVVRCCHLVRASKDLAQTSYFMASNSLHLTTMCLQYKPTVVACFCIHLACKWSNWEIPLSNEKKKWFSYVDPTVTGELLQQLTEEFLVIFERCPSRLKEKIMAIGDSGALSHSTSHIASPFETEPRKLHPPTDLKDAHHRLHHHEKAGIADPHKHRSSRPPHDGSSSQHQRERDYREKKERERIAQNSSSSKPLMPHPTNPSGKQSSATHSHHSRPPVDVKLKSHSRPPSLSVHPPPAPGRTEHNRDTTTSRVSDVSESNKDIQVRGSEKELEKTAYPVKPTVTDTNNLHQVENRASYSTDKRIDPTRSRQSAPAVDPKIHSGKHEVRRSHEQNKETYIKPEPVDKKHTSGWYDNKNNVYDKNSTYIKSSQKNPIESSKSVPKIPIKIEPHNGNNNGSYTLDIKKEVLDIEEPQYQPEKKRSMFSPEKTPPRKAHSSTKTTPTSTSKRIPPDSAILSPIDSSSYGNQRLRTASSSSEPELRPVMKKIDQVEGFENILRDSTIGIKNVAAPVESAAVEKVNVVPSFSVSLSQPIVNGIETNPMLISNLLKETPPVPHLPTITPVVETVPTEVKEKEHHHKDRKKKNKEKHKHKDKDKSKEDKEKKKKHRDKDKTHKSKERDKEKHHEVVPQQNTLKIKISTEKKSLPPELSPSSGSLKIKIPKDRIKTESIPEASSTPSGGPGIKIKIKGITDGKKRERDRNTSFEGPAHKVSKYSSRHSGDKQNGRNAYGSKVAHMGDGDVSVNRLAESKYINKGAST